MLDAVDKTLIPNAQNAELKALLVKVRPAFVAHLEHAKHVQASLAASRLGYLHSQSVDGRISPTFSHSAGKSGKK